MDRIPAIEQAPSTPLRAKYQIHKIVLLAELTDDEFKQLTKILAIHESPPTGKPCRQ